VFDDASDATQTVILVKKLLSEQKIDALIGPSGSPNSVGVVPFMAEAGTPMLAPVGATAVVLPMDDKKRWVFKTTQNDGLIAEALVAHMVKSGVKTVGFIGFNDPYGDSWQAVFGAQAQQAGIKVVASERFCAPMRRSPGKWRSSFAAKPDAVLVAAAGGPTVLPHITLVDAGYKGRIYQTHGAATPDFLRLGGAKVEGTVLAASSDAGLPEVPDSRSVQGRRARVHQRVREDVRQQAGDLRRECLRRGIAARAGGAGGREARQAGTPEFRAALRDALEATKDLVGTQGVYNMTPADHSGFDERGRVLITVKDGNWRLLRD
jgi:branched-chain amino acid transport system substrate-binding protein